MFVILVLKSETFLKVNISPGSYLFSACSFLALSQRGSEARRNMKAEIERNPGQTRYKATR